MRDHAPDILKAICTIDQSGSHRLRSTFGKRMKNKNRVIKRILLLLGLCLILHTAYTMWRIVTPDRINRVTKIPITAEIETLHLQMPKGLWCVKKAEENGLPIDGSFHIVSSDHEVDVRENSSEQLLFFTSAYVTKLTIEYKSTGGYDGKFLEVRASF